MNMRTEKVQNVNFKSGLSKKILLQEKFIMPKFQENLLAEQGVYADFAKSKSVALINKFCREILEKFCGYFSKELAIPPMISVYKPELAIKGENGNFCIPDTREVLKGEYPFIGRSIFFRDKGNLEQIDSITEKLYQAKRTSSSHFLAPYLHEWLHSLHLDYIYTKHGYGGTCHALNDMYPKKNTQISGYDLVEKAENVVLSSKENEVVYDILGEYSTKEQNQYLEIFAETFAKFICDSLSKDCASFIKDPIDLIKKTPKEFQEILKKVLNFEGFIPKQ